METDPGKWPRMELRPVGLVRSEIKSPMLEAGDADIALKQRMEKAREYHQQVTNAVCELVIFPEWEELLEGIEDFSHLADGWLNRVRII
jgi:tRNA (Thr-GGU) A37 N-methylase